MKASRASVSESLFPISSLNAVLGRSYIAPPVRIASPLMPEISVARYTPGRVSDSYGTVGRIRWFSGRYSVSYIAWRSEIRTASPRSELADRFNVACNYRSYNWRAPRGSPVPESNHRIHPGRA